MLSVVAPYDARVRQLVGTALVLVVVAAVWSWRDAPPSSHGADPVARPESAFAMTVTHVLDGDTIEATVVRPNATVTSADPVRIRLVGIEAPEVGEPAECWGPQATRWLRRQLPEGTRIRVAPGRDAWDDYGRGLFDVWAGERFVNLDLVRLGHARALWIRPNGTHRRHLFAAQEDAERERKGLWGTC